KVSIAKNHMIPNLNFYKESSISFSKPTNTLKLTNAYASESTNAYISELTSEKEQTTL
ncbi:10366_t:CDS:1, partial [Ambispora leptoticha]